MTMRAYSMVLRRAWGGSKLAACVVGLAMAGGAQTTINLKAPELITQGRSLYAGSCGVGYCHGAEGRAARAPKLRDRTWEPRRLFAITHDGVPGSSMPAWKDQLSDPEIWSIVAYIVSLSSAPLDDSAAVIELGPAEPAAPAARSEQAQQGRDLFFDLTNEKRCAVCHRLGGWGTAIGPDLAASAARKSADELLRDILKPNASIAKGFRQTDLSTNQGERIAGILQEETKELVRLYDMASIPPPLRTVYRDQIHAIQTRKRSSMPGDYGRVYSEGELQAIVAYLKSGKY